MEVSSVQAMQRAEGRPRSLDYARGEALVEEGPRLVDVQAADVPDPLFPLVESLEERGAVAVLHRNAVRASDIRLPGATQAGLVLTAALAPITKWTLNPTPLPKRVQMTTC